MELPGWRTGLLQRVPRQVVVDGSGRHEPTQADQGAGAAALRQGGRRLEDHQRGEEVGEDDGGGGAHQGEQALVVVQGGGGRGRGRLGMRRMGWARTSERTGRQQAGVQAGGGHRRRLTYVDRGHQHRDEVRQCDQGISDSCSWTGWGRGEGWGGVGGRLLTGDG